MKVERSDDLLIKLDQQRQNEIEESVEKIAPRNFFRGSEVGHCSRQIYYKRLGTPVGEMGANKSYFLDDGHLHQAVLSGQMKKAGIKVTGEEAEMKKTFVWKGISFVVTMHKDGTVRVGKEDELLEVKSVKEATFQDRLKTNDVSMYYDQTQMYLFGFGYKRCKLIIVDRNNSLRLEYTIQIDKERVKSLLNKLSYIEECLQNSKPPKCDHARNSKECGWCPYFKMCWGTEKGGYNHPKDKAEKSVEVEGKTEIKAWLKAVEMYKQYRDLKAEAKQHKEEADALMVILLKRFKATRLYGEGGSVTKSVGSRQIPDKAEINDLIIKGLIHVKTIEQVKLSYKVGNGEEEDE
jgi:CRISPR/Cas system-associated exonuclease Cas4 (RecB family)